MAVETVDFVDEEYVSPLQVGQDAGEVARFFDLGARSGVQGGSHGSCHNIGEGGFAQAGRS